MVYYCYNCAMLLHFSDELKSHCSTERHQIGTMSDDERDWKYRCFLGFPQNEWSICQRYVSGFCYESCQEAHGEEELKEWESRLNYRKMKLQHPTDFDFEERESFLNLPDEWLTPANHSRHVIAEDSKNTRITVNPNSTIIVRKSNSSREWTFKIWTELDLKSVGLLPGVDEEHFTLIGTTRQDGRSLNSRSQASPWNRTESPQRAAKCNYICKIKFTAPLCGRFSQLVAFHFDGTDVVSRKLAVEVVPEETFEELVQVRHFIGSIVPWGCREDITLVPCENRFPTSAIENASRTKYLIPANSEFIKPDFLKQYPSPSNYASRLHQFLYIEEMTQRYSISRYNCEASLQLISSKDDARLYGVKIGRNKFCAVAKTKWELTEDTEEARLLIQQCEKILVSSEHDSRTEVNRKVYEAVIEKKKRSSVVIWLSKECVEDFQIKPEKTFRVKLQFQLKSTQFVEMHKAVDDLQPVSLVFPDVSILPVFPSDADKSENREQRKAIETITHPLEERLPPVLIAGAFGTGKSFTIFEAAKRLLLNPSNRLLICTVSSGAADAYITDYFHPYVTAGHPEAKPLRLFYYNQTRANVDPTVLNYSNMVKLCGRLSFSKASKGLISKSRVVVTKLRTSHILNEIGLEQGFFTHIFIDEATEASECESITPLGLADEKTRIVLAGDFFQVSPKMYSLHAVEGQFHKSLFERLWNLYPETFSCKFVFTENYSSHAAIVDFVSRRFCEKTLTGKSKLQAHDTFYPLTCFSADANDLETTNTGFYNFAEVDVIVRRIKELKESWPKSWGPQDDSNIAVVAPYFHQVWRLKVALKKHNLPDVFVGNDVKSQGKRFRALFLSTVRSKKTLCRAARNTSRSAYNPNFSFFSDAKLVYSTLAKAQSLVAVVGHVESLRTIGNCRSLWSGFFSVCEQNNSFFVNTSTSDLHPQLNEEPPSNSTIKDLVPKRTIAELFELACSSAPGQQKFAAESPKDHVASFPHFNEYLPSSKWNVSKDKKANHLSPPYSLPTARNRQPSEGLPANSAVKNWDLDTSSSETSELTFYSIDSPRSSSPYPNSSLSPTFEEDDLSAYVSVCQESDTPLSPSTDSLTSDENRPPSEELVENSAVENQAYEIPSAELRFPSTDSQQISSAYVQTSKSPRFDEDPWSSYFLVYNKRHTFPPAHMDSLPGGENRQPMEEIPAYSLFATDRAAEASVKDISDHSTLVGSRAFAAELPELVVPTQPMGKLPANSAAVCRAAKVSVTTTSGCSSLLSSVQLGFAAELQESGTVSASPKKELCTSLSEIDIARGVLATDLSDTSFPVSCAVQVLTAESQELNIPWVPAQPMGKLPANSPANVRIAEVQAKNTSDYETHYRTALKDFEADWKKFTAAVPARSKKKLSADTETDKPGVSVTLPSDTSSFVSSGTGVLPVKWQKLNIPSVPAQPTEELPANSPEKLRVAEVPVTNTTDCLTLSHTDLKSFHADLEYVVQLPEQPMKEVLVNSSSAKGRATNVSVAETSQCSSVAGSMRQGFSGFNIPAVRPLKKQLSRNSYIPTVVNSGTERWFSSAETSQKTRPFRNLSIPETKCVSTYAEMLKNGKTAPKARIPNQAISALDRRYSLADYIETENSEVRLSCSSDSPTSKNFRREDCCRS